MIIIKSSLLSRFDEVQFGFSTKIGLGRKAPYYFNLSLSVGDNPAVVMENREHFFSSIGIEENCVAYQKQVHGDVVSIVHSPGVQGESDAMICTNPGVALAISSADCAPIFIYDSKLHLIAGVHSGWRGTRLGILQKTLAEIFNTFKGNPENTYVYIGPSLTARVFEVGKEFTEYFSSEYLQPFGDKFLFDNIKVNTDFLTKFEIPKKNIQVSTLCSYRVHHLFHSYRRDGAISGRALGVIALRK